MSVAISIDYNHMMARLLGVEHGITEADAHALQFLLGHAWDELLADVERGPLADYGFWQLPDQPAGKVQELEAVAAAHRGLADAHVILGIGGSYLGAQMLFDALCDPYHNEQTPAQRHGAPRIYFEGNGLDAGSLEALLRRVKGRALTVHVVSKSGGTIETNVAFELFRKHCGRNVKAWALTTDPGSPMQDYFGRLRLRNLTIFEHPENVGGRYSVLSPVGLFPAAMMGRDPGKLLAGAAEMRTRLLADRSICMNPASLYAAWQCLAARKGKDISVMALWEKRLEAFGNWYAQLSAESLGKDGVGRTPLTIVCTRELHSLGQLHQEGPRNRVITNVRVTGEASELAVPKLTRASRAHLASGRRVRELNDMAYEATDTAYATAQRPGMTVEVGAVDEEHLGALIFLFETATILEGKLLGVNPINQPGVKRYKDFLGARLGDPAAKDYQAEYDAWHGRQRDYRV